MISAVLDDNNPKDGTDNSSDDASRDPLEDLYLSEAPEYLHKQIRDMLKTHSSMWDGTLGVIRATKHAIVTPPDALPIRAQPYRTGPFKRQIIADQINKVKRAKPLNALTRAEIPPDLPPPTDVAIAAFEDLRNALLCPPVLALPKANRKLVFDVDACADQVGCTLLQEEPGKLLHPVGYWSRGLTAAEQNYSTTERECLGVVLAVLKLRHFLDGQRFLIRTDHQALIADRPILADPNRNTSTRGTRTRVRSTDLQP